MTTPERNFAHIRRQQFLTEGYYEELEPLIQKNINWLKLEDFTSENDKYNCGEANQWFNIASKTWKLLCNPPIKKFQTKVENSHKLTQGELL